MVGTNCIVIATVMGTLPGRIVEALGQDGKATVFEAQWECFDSARSAREWAAARGIVVDGKRYLFAPYVPINRSPSNLS